VKNLSAWVPGVVLLPGFFVYSFFNPGVCRAWSLNHLSRCIFWVCVFYLFPFQIPMQVSIPRARHVLSGTAETWLLLRGLSKRRCSSIAFRGLISPFSLVSLPPLSGSARSPYVAYTLGHPRPMQKSSTQ